MHVLILSYMKAGWRDSSYMAVDFFVSLSLNVYY